MVYCRRVRDDTIYWRCTRSRNCHCTGSITTGPGDTIISEKDSHNHPPDQTSIEVKKSVSAMKEKPYMYREELLKVAASPACDEVAAHMPTLVAVKSAQYRSRRKLTLFVTVSLGRPSLIAGLDHWTGLLDWTTGLVEIVPRQKIQ